MGTKILVVEDDENFISAVRLNLKNQPVEVTAATTGAGGIQAFRKNPLGFASIILDYKLPDLTGRDVAAQIKKLNPAQDILFTTGYSDPEFLSDMLESGYARSFIRKGRPPNEMVEKIMESVDIFQRMGRIVGQDGYSPSKTESDLKKYNLVGKSAGLHRVIDLVHKYRPLMASLRIIGETGTGKELIAKALEPSGKTSLILNCPEFNANEDKLEYELFGYKKGAFTGANESNPGLLMRAHGQVLFMDEIHTLSITAQRKFLRVLQEKNFRRMGDEKGTLIPINFRLITAAKPEIRDMVRDDRFLSDLYHRTGTLEIEIPPLRERPEDIEPLVRHFQDKVNGELSDDKQRQFRAATLEDMKRHPWTGNIRELEGAVYRMMVNAESDIVNPLDFEKYLKDGKVSSGQSGSHEPMQTQTRQVEFERITAALKSSWTQTEAAAKLGIDRYNLKRKMARDGINPNAYLLGRQG